MATSANIFKSKYPILAASMRHGSTLELALAVFFAGGYPSLSLGTYDNKLELLNDDLKRFKERTGSNAINIGLSLSDVKTQMQKFCKIVLDNELPTIEITFPDHYPEKIVRYLLQELHDNGVMIFRRVFELQTANRTANCYIDGLCLKGKEGAGVSGLLSTQDFFMQQKKLTPDIPLVPYSGIGTPAQVKYYIDLGAAAVGVGTLLAYSKENTISEDVKLSMISKTFNEINVQKDFAISNYLTSDPSITEILYSSQSQSENLKMALHSNEVNKGYTFVGESVNQINNILPVSEIINRLSSLL